MQNQKRKIGLNLCTVHISKQPWLRQKKGFTTKIEIDIFLIFRTTDVSERIGERKNVGHSILYARVQ